MLYERTPVLIAVADRDRRRETTRVLSAAGFEVWQARDYEDAVSLLHASPRRLVVLVDRDLESVLDFAAADRRLAHHHLYIALDSEERPQAKESWEHFSCLTVWRVAAPTPYALTQLVTRAARLLDLDTDAVGRRELAAR